MVVSGLNKIIRSPGGKGSCCALASRAPLNWSDLINLLTRGLCLVLFVVVFWVFCWDGVYGKVCVELFF